ncbi:phage tail assembly chaperone [Pseudomonas massiliensis]|uniref:phage tail assembly chaperone n=1 Tax=Pseudomonas massiliensis TaxID=522492 RepID=UPI00058CC564|nr:phage tail assembly chaperone [Pseudomonas massiliensis]
MPTFKIAQNPTFKATVQVPRIGGDPVPVEFEFKYMDRPALAELFDRWGEARRALLERVQKEELSLSDSTQAEIQLQAQQISEVTASWAFDEPFSEESVKALVTTCVGAPKAVIEAYQQAYSPSRLGNSQA